MVHIKNSDKKLLIVMLVFVMITISSTSIFFLLGGSIKTSQLSEVNASRVYVTPPNSTAISNALDQIGCKNNVGVCSLSSPKLLYDSQIILFDSNQNQIPSSTYTNIPIQASLFNEKIPVSGIYGGFSVPKLSLTDSNGHLLDLGTVQYKPFAVTNTDTNVLFTGQFAVYLDDVIQAHRSVAGSGTTVNKILPLYIDNQPAYTFTFADEGKNWADKSVHIFKIVVGNVTATTGVGENTQTFASTQNSLVYVLVMTVDQQKVTTIGVDNKAISIFKSDDSFTACGRNAQFSSQHLGYQTNDEHDYVYVSKYSTGTGLINIYENGFLLTSLDSEGHTPDYNANNVDSIGSDANQKVCVTKTGLPRDSDLTINIGTNSFVYHTPLSQFTMIYDCSGDSVPNDPVGSGVRLSGVCPSNFISNK